MIATVIEYAIAIFVMVTFPVLAFWGVLLKWLFGRRR